MVVSKRTDFFLGRLDARLVTMQSLVDPFVDRGYYNAAALRTLVSDARSVVETHSGEEPSFSLDDYRYIANCVDQFSTTLSFSRYPRTVFQEPPPRQRRQSNVLLLREEIKAVRQILSGLMVDLENTNRSIIQPEQGPGPHFGIEQGKITFSIPSTHDVRTHNSARLKTLLPLLRDLIEQALSVFGRNSAHGGITTSLRNYAAAISADWSSIDYELLAAYGVVLSNAEAASKRFIQDRLTPPLEDDQAAILRSILDLHGPFILSTEAGRRLIDDAASYSQSQEQENEFKVSATDIADAIRDAGIATESVGALLVEATKNIGNGPHPQRSSIVGGNVVRNATIVLIAGALVAYPIAATAGMGLLTGWITTVLIAEGVKKSRVGQDVADAVRLAIDDPSQRQNLQKLAQFAKKHDGQLRSLAGSRREFRWLHDWLDWLGEQTDVSS